MTQFETIGLVAVGITALVVLVNGLTTLLNNWWASKNRPNDDHLDEYKEFKSETNTLLKSLEGTLHNLDKTITKLDLTLDNVTSDQLQMRKDIDDVLIDVDDLKNIIFKKQY